jgi:hypothetical protein
LTTRCLFNRPNAGLKFNALVASATFAFYGVSWN